MNIVLVASYFVPNDYTCSGVKFWLQGSANRKMSESVTLYAY